MSNRYNPPPDDYIDADELKADIERAKWLAYWQDARFDVMGIKFGMDAVLGLIPGIGDTLTTLAGLYPVLLAGKHGLGRDAQARMLLNLGIDWAVGIVPVVGDLADVAYKANLKNIQVLENAVERKLKRRR